MTKQTDLLDQLAAQAKQKQADEEAASRDAQERAAYYHEATEPAIQRLLDYLKQLTSHLNYLAEPLQGTYTLPYYGEVVASLRPDFKTQFASGEEKSNIRLSVTATIPPKTAPKVTLHTPIADQFIEQVAAVGLKLKKKVERTSRGKIVEGQFQVYGDINILVTIQAEASTDTIEFSFINLDRFNKVSHSFHPEEIDKRFLDQLGRYITRQSDALKREQLSGEQRARLRRAVQRDTQYLLKSLFDRHS